LINLNPYETSENIAKNSLGFFKARSKNNITSTTTKNNVKPGVKQDIIGSNSKNMFSIRKPVIIKK